MFHGDFPTTHTTLRDTTSSTETGPLFRYVLNFLRTSELTLPCDITEMDLLSKTSTRLSR